MSETKWIPLESNPEAINNYIAALGFPISLYKFTDVLSCEEWAIALLPKPVLGYLILSKKCTASTEAFKRRVQESSEFSENLYYMHQLTDNACGTIGILHIIANSVFTENIPLEEGSFLQRFLTNTFGMTPQQRGEELQPKKKESQREETKEKKIEIKEANDNAAKSGQSKVNGKVDMHFVAIVPKDYGIYELDGGAKKPIFHGYFENFEFEAISRVVYEHFFQINPNDHNFSILALVPNIQEDF